MIEETTETINSGYGWGRQWVSHESLIVETRPINYNDKIELMICSDLHYDSSKCDQDLVKRHFDLAVKRGAGIIIVGDLFDAMQSKRDSRGSRGSLRKELKVDNYADALVDYVVTFLMPYRHNIIMIGEGNHESAFLRHMETDLIGRTVHALNDAGANIHRAGYNGYIVFRSRWYDGKGGGNLKYFFHHGSGGNSPVTKGTIQANRISTWNNANIVSFGHLHGAWIVPYMKQEVGNAGKVKEWQQLFIHHPSYKKMDSWAKEKGFPPSPRGCAWVTMKGNHDRSLGYTAQLLLGD